MGIITRLYFRSEDLADNRFNVFFMDMGENIHIHYRDLRIELSSDEFIEFSELFKAYAPEVLEEINKGYRDGVHPNTNQTHTLTTFSNKKPLNHSIRYHPNRISIEENLDGYHIHLRNYKILLDKPSFASFVRAARELIVKRESPIDIDEAISLIDINDLPHYIFERKSADGLELGIVIVEKPYFRKAQQLLEGLRYAKINQTVDTVVYEKPGEQIQLRIGSLPRLALSGKTVSALVPLSEYISKNAKRFSPEEINLLKLQYLDTSKHIGKNKLENLVELDYRNLIYDIATNRIIFPTKGDGQVADTGKLYDLFMSFLKDQGLSFVKPAKVPYSDAENSQLQLVFDDFINKTLGSIPCVSKVYLFNAESKKRSGRYQVPFVHFDWAKLGSDFDLLIEIDEHYPVPKDWSYKFFWKVCGSDYYLLGDVNYPIASSYIDRFKNVDFYHHLVEAYLFFGSKGNHAVKDAFLKKHNAKLIYQKDAGSPMVETTELLRRFLVENYCIDPNRIEKVNVPSFNEIYRVTTQDKEFAAKLMERGDFTPSVNGRTGQHLEYEEQLLHELDGRELQVVFPLPGNNGRVLQQFHNRFCMLFPFITSNTKNLTQTDTIHAAAESLALLHHASANLNIPSNWYRFNEFLEYWIDQYVTHHVKFSDSAVETDKYISYIPLIKTASSRILSADSLPWVHVHCDVCPRNFFYVNGKAHLYDFQVAHYGPRIEDVAEGAIEFAVAGNTIDKHLIDEFINSYCATNDISSAERERLPDMLVLQAGLKLARSFRLQVVFGYKVSTNRVLALSNYIESYLCQS